MAKIYNDSLYWQDIVSASLGKYLILRALAEEPLHGYALIRKIRGQTKNFFSPTEGSVYPILRDFMECGCVTMKLRVFRGRERKEYVLTARGHRAHRTAEIIWRKGIKCLNLH